MFTIVVDIIFADVKIVNVVVVIVAIAVCASIIFNVDYSNKPSRVVKLFEFPDELLVTRLDSAIRRLIFSRQNSKENYSSSSRAKVTQKSK